MLYITHAVLRANILRKTLDIRYEYLRFLLLQIHAVKSFEVDHHLKMILLWTSDKYQYR